LSQLEKQKEVLDSAENDFKTLFSELVEIESQMTSGDWQPARFKRVQILAQNPEISTKVEETKNKLKEFDSLEHLRSAVNAAKDLLRILKSITTSPSVEELLGQFRELLATTGAKASKDLESEIRKCFDEVREEKITELSEFISQITAEYKQLSIFSSLFRDWLNLALQNLHEEEMRLDALASWVKNISEGIDTLLSLDRLMSDITNNNENLRNVSLLVRRFYNIAYDSVVKNPKDSVKKSLTYWKETLEQIGRIWDASKTKLKIIDNMIGGLTEGEKHLFMVSAEELHVIESEKFVGQLDKFTELLSNISEGKIAIGKITRQLDLVREADVSKTPFQLLFSNLERLNKEIPSPDSVPSLDEYSSRLKKIGNEIGKLDEELKSLINQVREGARAWVSICERKKELSNLASEIKTTMACIDVSNELDVAVQTYLKLNITYSKIKEVLTHEADPLILDVITKISSLKGAGKAISLSEIEKEARKSGQGVTLEQIAVALADMHANKLIRLEVIASGQYE
jgi:hypothetical protein